MFYQGDHVGIVLTRENATRRGLKYLIFFDTEKTHFWKILKKFTQIHLDFLIFIRKREDNAFERKLQVSTCQTFISVK